MLSRLDVSDAATFTANVESPSAAIVPMSRKLGATASRRRRSLQRFDTKYCSTMTAETAWPMTVARAEPVIPSPMTMTSSQLAMHDTTAPAAMMTSA